MLARDVLGAAEFLKGASIERLRRRTAACLPKLDECELEVGGFDGQVTLRLSGRNLSDDLIAERAVDVDRRSSLLIEYPQRLIDRLLRAVLIEMLDLKAIAEDMRNATAESVEAGEAIVTQR